jgi:hypothetical protein
VTINDPAPELEGSKVPPGLIPVPVHVPPEVTALILNVPPPIHAGGAFAIVASANAVIVIVTVEVDGVQGGLSMVH